MEKAYADKVWFGSIIILRGGQWGRFTHSGLADSVSGSNYSCFPCAKFCAFLKILSSLVINLAFNIVKILHQSKPERL